MAIQQVAAVATPKVAVMPKTENKADKFKRLAELRVGNTLDKIRLIGNLGGAGYESTKEQRDYIRETLEGAIVDALNNLSRVRMAKAIFKL